MRVICKKVKKLTLVFIKIILCICCSYGLSGSGQIKARYETRVFIIGKKICKILDPISNVEHFTLFLSDCQGRINGLVQLLKKSESQVKENNGIKEVFFKKYFLYLDSTFETYA